MRQSVCVRVGNDDVERVIFLRSSTTKEATLCGKREKKKKKTKNRLVSSFSFFLFFLFDGSFGFCFLSGFFPTFFSSWSVFFLRVCVCFFSFVFSLSKYINASRPLLLPHFGQPAERGYQRWSLLLLPMKLL